METYHCNYFHSYLYSTCRYYQVFCLGVDLVKDLHLIVDKTDSKQLGTIKFMIDNEDISCAVFAINYRLNYDKHKSSSKPIRAKKEALQLQKKLGWSKNTFVDETCIKFLEMHSDWRIPIVFLLFWMSLHAIPKMLGLSQKMPILIFSKQSVLECGISASQYTPNEISSEKNF